MVDFGALPTVTGYVSEPSYLWINNMILLFTAILLAGAPQFQEEWQAGAAPAGTHIAVCDFLESHTLATIWDKGRGRMRTMRFPSTITFRGSEGLPGHLAISSKGEYLAIGKFDRWSVVAGDPARHAVVLQNSDFGAGDKRRHCACVSFSEDTRVLAWGGVGVTIWSLAEKKEAGRVGLGDERFVQAVALCGEALVAMSSTKIEATSKDLYAPSRVDVWDWKSGARRFTVKGVRQEVKQLLWVKDSETLVLIGENGRTGGHPEILLVDVGGGAVKQRIEPTCRRIASAAVSRNGHFLGVTDYKGNVLVWDMRTGGRFIWQLDNPRRAARVIATFGEGARFAVIDRQGIQVVDAGRRETVGDETSWRSKTVTGKRAK